MSAPLLLDVGWVRLCHGFDPQKQIVYLWDPSGEENYGETKNPPNSPQQRLKRKEKKFKMLKFHKNNPKEIHIFRYVMQMNHSTWLR